MNIQKLIQNWKTTSSGLTLIIGSITHLAFQIKAHAVDEGAISIFAVGFLGGLGLLLAADGQTPPPTDDPPAPPAAKIAPLLILVVMLGTLPFLTTACTSGPQRVAFNSLYSVEHVTSSAYDGYLDSVIAGTTSTNGVPKVSRAYNDFQASFSVALDAVQFNTNAIAPSSLVIESGDVINLITTLKGK